VQIVGLNAYNPQNWAGNHIPGAYLQQVALR
jgi:hypothetical protein